MVFLVAVSFLAAICLALANPLLGDVADDSDLLFGSFDDPNSQSLFEESNDVNSNPLLFGSSDLALLPPDDDSSYGPTMFFENPDTEPTMLQDENHFDYPIDLASADESCSAKDDFQSLGKLRARDPTVCSPKVPAAAAPLPLQLPTVDGLFDLFKNKPKANPIVEPEIFPPLPPLGSPIDAAKCLHPYYTERLCCAGPLGEVMESPRPVPIYEYIEGCKESKPPRFL